MKPVPVLVVGPSGVGKNVIIDRIVPMFPNLEFYKTTTTRPQRTPGEDKYHFVSEEAFTRLIEAGAFLEWEEFDHHRYGTQIRHLREILDRGQYPVPRSAIDVRGVVSYKRTFPGTLAIFIAYESLGDMPDRLRRTRPMMTEQDIAGRLAIAQREMEQQDVCEATVINRAGKLDEAVEEVAQIIEHHLGLRRHSASGSVPGTQGGA
ncbi:hypothetical protein HY375_01815 [Candidatus Berkelbacteria bacterium]|nr:hypothetical protein [Candidatus Berkelbacteria bacterium]